MKIDIQKYLKSTKKYNKEDFEKLGKEIKEKKAIIEKGDLEKYEDELSVKQYKFIEKFVEKEDSFFIKDEENKVDKKKEIKILLEKANIILKTRVDDVIEKIGEESIKEFSLKTGDVKKLVNPVIEKYTEWKNGDIGKKQPESQKDDDGEEKKDNIFADQDGEIFVAGDEV